jgi:arylsulfatase A-like enzyme
MDMYRPADMKLPENFLPEHPFDNGELRIRDELLAPIPRTPEAMRRHLADYYASITCFDFHLGRILDELRRQGMLKNTLIVFTSDHGLAVGGMHGLMGKQNLYEHNKPPLILVGPGIPRNRRSDALVYLIDLFPTVVDAVGLNPPKGIEGQTLMPIVRGEKSAVRTTIYGAYRNCQRMIRDERWKLIAYDAGGVRNVQLFDLKADPDERTNLATDPRHTAERQRLEKQLAESQRQFDDPQAVKTDTGGSAKSGRQTAN